MVDKYYYDFHIHSCLSPCGDNDMTPNNIAGMAVIKGLNILALTDHNTLKNCPSFFKACKKQGIIPIAGVEVTTSEDVHMICLFEKLEDAMLFDEILSSKRVLIQNEAEIFGHQYICDEDDNIIGEEENLLINATGLSIDELFDIVEKNGGICYPAHIDKDSNGIVAMLGTIPETPVFTSYEIHSFEKTDEFKERFRILNNMNRVVSSDAHYLWDISEAENFFEIETEKYSADIVRHKVFSILKGETQ